MQKTILIAEDNELNLELTSILVKQYCEEKKQDINLLTATNGQDAENER